MAFPEYACEYSKRLAERSRRFARQVYDPVRGPAEPRDDGFGIDPFGELSHASKVKGLKQRFPDRVLVMTSERCFMNCRHCTRQWLFGRTETVETEADLARCLDYVKARPKVRDVLLSGGDPLTLSDSELMRFVDAFAALPQLDVVRVCTRAPCTNPSRVTARLAKMLGRSGKVWVNTQFNCADELTDEARAAAARLVDAGIPEPGEELPQPGGVQGLAPDAPADLQVLTVDAAQIAAGKEHRAGARRSADAGLLPIVPGGPDDRRQSRRAAPCA